MKHFRHTCCPALQVRSSSFAAERIAGKLPLARGALRWTRMGILRRNSPRRDRSNNDGMATD